MGTLLPRDEIEFLYCESDAQDMAYVTQRGEEGHSGDRGCKWTV